MDINNEHLTQFANYLRANKKSISKHFDMEYFMYIYNDDIGDGYFRELRDTEGDIPDLFSCGTTACLLGHATIPFPPEINDRDWDRYGIRVFGLEFGDLDWSFLFGSGWANSVYDGIRRIEYFVKNGVPQGFRDPTEWDEENLRYSMSILAT